MTANDVSKTASLSLNRSPYSKGASRLASDLERTTVSKIEPTPGQWRYVKGGQVRCGDMLLGKFGEYPEAEDEANAKLAAAAPALLEACRKALLLAMPPNRSTADVQATLRAALTLATGGAK